MSDVHSEVDFDAAEEQGNDYYSGDDQDSASVDMSSSDDSDTSSDDSD